MCLNYAFVLYLWSIAAFVDTQRCREDYVFFFISIFILYFVSRFRLMVLLVSLCSLSGGGGYDPNKAFQSLVVFRSTGLGSGVNTFFCILTFMRE